MVADTTSSRAATPLNIRGLDKSFGSTRALHDVDLDVAGGTIHALLGGNGSGKSTLIKILAGVYAADAGTIVVGDTTLATAGHGPAVAAEAGLRFVHQNLGIFLDLSVAENLALGHGFVTRRPARIDWASEHRRAAELIERFGIHATSATLLGELRPADHAMVAIARALQDLDSVHSGVLVLDEPTASLPKVEVDVVLGALRRYAAAGQTIVLVGHRLDEVLDLADDVTVLRDGEVVARRPTRGLVADDLVRDMLGRSVDDVDVAPHRSSIGAPLLSLRHVHAGPLDGLDLDVWPGEVVGVAGLLGSGRSTLLTTLFGVRPPAGGSMLLDGVAGFPATVRDAMRRGIALVPEDRERDGTFPDMSVRHNLSSSVVERYWRRLRLRHGEERTDAVALVSAFDVRPATDEPAIGTLSGGNQQKVVMARWLRRSPRLVLLDEPTQGVDVGARAAIHRHVRASAAAGAATLLVSSDLEELALVCDRVVVLAAGRIVGEITAPHITGEALASRCYAAAAPAAAAANGTAA